MTRTLGEILGANEDYFETNTDEKEFLEYCVKHNLDINNFYIYEKSILGSRYCDYIDFENNVFIEIHILSLKYLKMVHFPEMLKERTKLWKNGNYLQWIASTHRRFYNQALRIISQEIDNIADKTVWDLFSYIWVDAEYLLNNSLSRNLLLEFFKYNYSRETDIEKIKTKENYNNGLLTIYRGESNKSTPLESAFSWTLSKEKAFWFANRFDNKNPIVYKAEIPIEEVLAYFEPRNEEEIIIDFKKCNFKPTIL